jgi:hypothetical protein
MAAFLDRYRARQAVWDCLDPEAGMLMMARAGTPDTASDQPEFAAPRIGFIEEIHFPTGHAAQGYEVYAYPESPVHDLTFFRSA